MKRNDWTQLVQTHTRSKINDYYLARFEKKLEALFKKPKAPQQYPWLAQSWPTISPLPPQIETTPLPQGVSIKPLDLTQANIISLLKPFSLCPAALLNLATLQHGHIITCDANAQIIDPIHITHLWHNHPVNSMVPVFIWIKMEKNSQMTLLETQQLHQQLLFKNVIYFIQCEPDAKLRHQVYHGHAQNRVHYNQFISAQTQSQYQSCQWVIQGASQNHHSQIHLDGAHAACQIHTLSFADQAAKHLFDCTITHHANASTSQQDFCHLIGQSAHAATNCTTIIKKQTQATQSTQSIDSKLLSPHAQTHPNPILIVETPEVAQCQHAATTGKLDQDMLFYLKTRGLNEKEAVALLLNQYVMHFMHTHGHPHTLKLWQQSIKQIIDKTIELQN